MKGLNYPDQVNQLTTKGFIAMLKQQHLVTSQTHMTFPTGFWVSVLGAGLLLPMRGAGSFAGGSLSGNW